MAFGKHFIYLENTSGLALVHNGYAFESVELEAIYGQGSNVLFTHSHNIIMQLLAEQGAVGFLLITLPIIWSFSSLFLKKNLGSNELFISSLATVIIIHSLLEYPLWHFSFLAIFSILLGLNNTLTIRIHPLPKLRKICIALFSTIILYQTAIGTIYYFKWASWVYPTTDADENRYRLEQLLTHRLNPFWEYEADLIISNYMPLTPNSKDLKISILEKQANYRPYPVVLFKLSIMKAYANDDKEALSLMSKAYTLYPKKIMELYPQLSQIEGGKLDEIKSFLRSKKEKEEEEEGGGAGAIWVFWPNLNTHSGNS